MKKTLFLLLVLSMSVSAFADSIKVSGTPPTVRGGVGADVINEELAAAFANVIDNLNNQFQEINYDNPKNLIQAMGDSSVYASHGATVRGYGGYKLFSATVGLTVGIQLPESISSIMDDANKISESLEKEGDIKLGLSPNFFNAHVGLNMGIFKFLPEHLGFLKRDNLYIGMRIGYFHLPNIIDNLSYNNFTLGLTANYQVIPSISLAGLVTWRGLNIGTGFIYNGANIGLTAPLGDDITEPLASGGSLIMGSPKAALNLNVYTFTIPLEAVTAIKLIIFNIPFGVGADLAFGSSSLDYGIASDVKLSGLPSGYYQDKKGEFHVDGGASRSPSFFNFKIITGLGITAGPVVFDIPITIYPANNGYTFGLTIGAVL